MGQPSLTTEDYKVYYADKLEEGLRFQDFITDVLYDQGMIVVTYVSKERGRNAENKLGIEIKRDNLFRKTGNLYIETAEKSNPSKLFWTQSGIYRDDNSWLYAIGDEKTLWIFSKKYLRLLENRFVKKEIPTSKGFLMSTVDGDKYCLRRIDITVSS
jgi:hypothetical protein